MSNKEFSPIKLQLEEAIWLDHRAESAEIISLELIPDVDIVEDDYFVNIRGHLILTGKYETEDGEESLDLESSSLAQQLQFDPLSVEPKEIYEQAYRGKIEHRFPFDVTVPANKVSNLEDVYVQVEQFDYSISDGHRLQIKTEIMITGIENEAAQVEEKQEQKVELKEEKEVSEQKKDKPESKVWSDFLPARNTDAQEAKDDVRDEQQEVRKEVAEPSPNETTAESAASKEDKEVKEVSRQEGTQQKQEEQQEQSIEQESAETGSEERPVLSDWVIEGLEDKIDENVVPLFPQEIKTTFSSRPEKDDAAAEEILAAQNEQANRQEEQARAEQRNKTVSFLTKLMEFGEDGEDETQKRKLRMCIIQQNESLEDISERYDISVYELMKANNLETDQITKGQILYIPRN